MQVIGRRNADRIEVLVGEYLAPIVVERDILPAPLKVGALPAVDVGSRHEGDRLVADNLLAISPALTAEPDSNVLHSLHR